MGYLARWARRLSWLETARAFATSWEAVYRSVEWFVEWGLAHRQLRGVESIGVDEIHWGRGKRAENFLTVISNRSPCTTSGPSAFSPRRNVACVRRRPTHSKRRQWASIW